MAFPTNILALADAIGSQFLNLFHGGTVSHSDGTNQMLDDLVAVETKLGIGATTPDATHKAMKATAAGTSAWGYYGAVLLDSKTGTGASGVIEFSSINQNFGSLLLVGDGRSDTAATSSSVGMTFETSPTAGAYNHVIVFGSQAGFGGSDNFGATDSINAGLVPAASSTANLYGSIQVLIPNYANTTKFKTTQGTNTDFREISATNFYLRQVGGCWESTAAIDRIRLTLAAGNWTALSHFKLYGLPGA